MTTFDLAIDAGVGEATTGYAALAGYDEDKKTWVVNGVALGPNDVTRGKTKKRTIWTPEVLKRAVNKLKGVPITKGQVTDPHPGTDGSGEALVASNEVPDDMIIGRVTKAGWDNTLGLLYQGEITDEDTAKAAENGDVDVSPVMDRDITPVDNETDTYMSTAINKFRDLTVLPPGLKGASASNSINSGQAEALMSAVEALVSSGDAVRWSSDAGGDREPAGTRYGLVIDDLQDDEESKVLVAVYQANADRDGWENRGEENRMEEDNLTVIGSDGKASLPAVSDVFDGGTEANVDGQVTDKDTRSYSSYMGDDSLTDRQKELLAVAGQLDNPKVVESDAADRFQAAEALVDAAEEVDEPAVVDAEEYAETKDKAAAVEEMETIMDDRLTDEDGYGLRSEVVENMNFKAKAAQFTNEDGEFQAEALIQSPETSGTDDNGGTPGGSGSGDGGGDGGGSGTMEIEALSGEVRTEVMDLSARAKTFDSIDSSHADKLRQQAADAAGVDDYDKLEGI